MIEYGKKDVFLKYPLDYNVLDHTYFELNKNFLFATKQTKKSLKILNCYTPSHLAML